MNIWMHCFIAAVFALAASAAAPDIAHPIQARAALVRIAIVGDSTVADYKPDDPHRGWGQLFPEFVDAKRVTVKNFAANGRSTKTFKSEGRWEKMLAFKPDYVFVQFGHNDSHAKDHPESTDADTDFSLYLREYVDSARFHGAIPILVTPMHRGQWEKDGVHLTRELLPYAAATRRVAAEKNAPLVDLYARSEAAFERIGKEKLGALFAFPDKDRTHFNEKGARLLAGMAAEETARVVPVLKSALILPDAGAKPTGSIVPETKASAVWQWSTLVTDSRENTGKARAFLWIPETCRWVRGVVVAQNNMEEESILENPRFRRALADVDFAEIWVSPPFDHLFRFDQGAGETFEGMIADLAAASGYAELKDVPVVPMGHSAAASWPYYFAAWKAERTLAALSVSGQWPYVRSPVFSPDIWGNRNIDFIPCLETMGEYESAESWANEGLKERAGHPQMPLSMLANPGQGHFAATDAKVDYLTFYLRKAVQYRMPHDPPAIGAPHLTPIDPTKSGWLAERWHRDRPPTAPAAPVGSFTGEPAQAFWFFDEEMARATEAYQAACRGLKPQLVGYLQDGRLVPQQDQHLQVTLAFQPDADGVTFHLSGAFYDTVPGGSPRPTIWVGLPVGSPLGHASAGGPISIGRISGPFEKIGPDTFRIALQKETLAADKRYELVFAATHPGDAEYRPAVQQAHLYIPARNTAGAPQTITFPPIGDQKIGTASVTLAATSDAGLPVSYYVREGPAIIDGDVLRFTAVPPRAKLPIRVTVVAWQYGRLTEPPVQTAVPVEQSFDIKR